MNFTIREIASNINNPIAVDLPLGWGQWLKAIDLSTTAPRVVCFSMWME